MTRQRASAQSEREVDPYGHQRGGRDGGHIAICAATCRSFRLDHRARSTVNGRPLQSTTIRCRSPAYLGGSVATLPPLSAWWSC